MVDKQKRVRIELPTDSMTRAKSASGGVSFHCGDHVAEQLKGLPVDQVESIGDQFEMDVSKYGHLNPGQRRMNIGNLLRTFLRKHPEEQPRFDDAVAEVRHSYDADRQQAADARAAEVKARADKRAEEAQVRADAKAQRDLEREQRATAKQAEKDQKRAARASTKKQGKEAPAMA